MYRVRLVIWDTTAAEKRAGELQASGYEVDTHPFEGQPSLKEMSADPPAACIIDLIRAPSQGRDVGVAMRHNAGTRHIPLVFIEGDLEQTERVRALLPDAAYTSWTRIDRTLKRAIEHPPTDPIVISPEIQRSSGRPDR